MYKSDLALNNLQWLMYKKKKKKKNRERRKKTEFKPDPPRLKN